MKTIKISGNAPVKSALDVYKERAIAQINKALTEATKGIYLF